MCWFTGTAEKVIGADIPAINTRICMFPMRVVFENDRLGGWDLDEDIVGLERSCIFGCEGIVCRPFVSTLVCATDSWRSCAHCESAGPID